MSGAQWSRLEGIGNKEQAEFQLLAPYAEDGSLLEQDIVQRIDSDDIRARSSAELSIYARARPRTATLKALCLITIEWSPSGHTLPDVDNSLTAATILGGQFREDSNLRGELERRLRDSEWKDEFALITLCALWPSTAAVKEAFDGYRKHEHRLRYLPTFPPILRGGVVAKRALCDRLRVAVSNQRTTDRHFTGC